MTSPARIRAGVRRRTLADEVHEQLRAAIAADELAAGERLKIDALAQELGVSATPVREALARLASEGLASYEPLVGYRVEAPLDADAFDQLMEARRLLEPRIAKLAAERRLDDDLDALSPDVLAAGDPAADAAFHAWVAACADNPFLAATQADLRAHVQTHRLDGSGADATAVEHRAVHDAIVAGDGPGASAAMAAHLERSYRRHEAEYPIPDE